MSASTGHTHARASAVSSARVAERIRRPALEALSVLAGAVLLRLIAGVGFANYDTLYALAWGGQLSRGDLPAYGVPIAPTPHPLVEVLGIVLAPLGPHAVQQIAVALGFIALSACGWVIYRLGAQWFGWAAGALAALIFLTRVPVLSDGVRAYIDLPYLAFVLSALLVESRRPRAGAPVLVLLALAGLLRPEAWAFSALYWLYLIRSSAPRTRAEIVRLTLLAASAPLIWMLSDLLITGQPLWSLTNTRHTASTLDRTTGIANVPQYIPRRIGEILRPPVLLGAALGGVLSLLWLRRRALVGAAAGLLAVIVFALFATAGLPINTRYAFLAAAILAIFCGAGVFGWMRLAARGPAQALVDRRRDARARRAARLRALASTTPLIANFTNSPASRRSKATSSRSSTTTPSACAAARSACPTTRPSRCSRCTSRPAPPTSSAPTPAISPPASTSTPPAARSNSDYVLDPRDPVERASIPPGFTAFTSNRSWLVFKRCVR